VSEASRPPTLVAVLGPTASGKSALALRLAARYRGEIVNCDSTAVYRGFDIGTDKVPVEQQQGIPHHLIDIADPTDEYTAAQYARDAANVIREIHGRGNLPLLVGGTVLLSGTDARALPRTRQGSDAAPTPRLNRVPARRGVPAPDAAADRSPVGAAHPAARSEAHDPRARGLFLTGRRRSRKSPRSSAVDRQTARSPWRCRFRPR
jgi:tRNA dimethylallyltransferase